MTAAEDVIHNKDDRSSDDLTNISKKKTLVVKWKTVKICSISIVKTES